MRRLLVLFALIGLTLAGCTCSSTSTAEHDSERRATEQTDEQDAAGLEDWQPIFHEQTPELESLRGAEEKVVEYFATDVIPRNALSDGSLSYLVTRLREKGTTQKRLEDAFFDLMDNDGMTNAGRSHAGFRLGEMYFDFACQIRGIELPTDLSREKRAHYSEKLHREYVAPLMVMSREFFVAGLRFGVPPWAKKMRSLAGVLPETSRDLSPQRAADMCQTHRRIWASPAALNRARSQVPADKMNAADAGKDREAGPSALEGMESMYPPPEMGYGRVGSDDESDGD